MEFLSHKGTIISGNGQRWKEPEYNFWKWTKVGGDQNTISGNVAKWAGGMVG